MINDKDLKKLLKQESIPKFSTQSLEKTIEKSKNIYINQERKKLVSDGEFILLQMKFINKKFWLFQITILIILAIFLINNTSNNVSINSSTYFSVSIPLIVISSIPELYRSIQCNSFEIENCSYFSLKKVYLAKLIIMGMSDLLFATIVIFIASQSTKLPLYQLIIYFLVPFNSTCCICFTSLAYSKKVTSQLGCISIGFIWTVILYHNKDKFMN